jgi:phosphatidylglycerophosphatase A
LALPLAWWLFRLGGLWTLLAAAVVATVVGIWAASRAELYYTSHDSRHIVIDELAGQLLTLVPVACSWPNLVVGFVWFRFFDVVKPWPAGWIDKNVGGGLGVMLDDVAAAGWGAAATAMLVHTGVVGWVVASIS